MKTTTKLKCCSALAIAACMASASATPSYTADTLLGSAMLPNSGKATELAEFKKFVPELTALTKVNVTKDATATQDAADPNYWIIDLGNATPGYFLLKFGTGNTDKNNTYFFQNNADLTKLVFSNADVSFLTGGADCTNNGKPKSCNIGRLSHYAYGGEAGGGGNVPEPGSLALLGLGFAGLAMRLRSRAR